MVYKEKRKTLRIRFNQDADSKIILYVNGVEYVGKLCDYSRFGVGVAIDIEKVTNFEKIQAVENAVIEAFGKRKELGKANVARMATKDGYAFLGLYLEFEFIDMDFLIEKQTLNLQEDEIKKLRMHFSVQEKLRSDFSNFVSRFTYGLSLYKIALDELDSKFDREPKYLKEVLFRAVCNGIGKDFYQFLSQSIEELKEVTSKYTKHESEFSGFFLRKSIFHFLLQAEFLKRTNLRPKGYAGDSVMMEMVYRNEYLGSSTFGKIFHKHSIETSAADAVRNRRKLINRLLEQVIEETEIKEFRVLSVACGPAWEVQDFLRDSPYREKVKFFLLDQDAEALAEAKESIAKIENGKYLDRCQFIQESVRTLLKTKDPEILFGQFDFIYSMGLYDYLADAVAKALTAKFFSLVIPGGQLVIGNYHERNETRKYMEYIMDWVLYYRDEESMVELLENIPEKPEYHLDFEDSGNQMFIKVKKFQN